MTNSEAQSRIAAVTDDLQSTDHRCKRLQHELQTLAAQHDDRVSQMRVKGSDEIATVAAESPEVRYVVAGRTHPAVVRAHGERYRDELLALVEELGLDKHVVFVDRFLSLKDLAGLLAITDVFCTPYHGKEQIVSGALTFALVAGCPVVSTPYRYASDVLANGAGILVPFKESDAMATAISHLLVRGPARLAAVTAANTYAMGMSWPDVGRTLRTVLANARSSAPRAAV